MESGYEFEAPKFADFEAMQNETAPAQEATNAPADSWFDTHTSGTVEQAQPMADDSMMFDANMNTSLDASGFLPNKRTAEDAFADSTSASFATNGAKRMRLTIPQSPKFHEMRRTTKPTKTTEELELEALEAKRKEKRRQLMVLRRSMKKALTAKPVIPLKSGRELTVPQEFRFATEQRFKKEAENDTNTNNKTYQFKIGRTTIASGHVGADGKLTLTMPQPFRFRTDERKRPVHYEGYEKIVEKELSEMPKFKALPLNEKVLYSAGDYGVPRVEKRAVTEAHSPKLATELRSSRIREREAADMPQEETFVFKALPLRESVLSGDKTITAAPVEEKKLTKPVSPQLHTKIRFENKHHNPEEPEEQFVFKARPVPVNSPFKVEHSVRELTQPQPFQLKTDERGEMRRKELEDELRRKEAEEKSMREFHARPVPDFTDDVQMSNTTKAVETRPLTEPQPFNLASEHRHQQYVQVWQDKILQETVKEAETRLFHARPLPVTHANPFVPNIEPKPATQAEDVPLVTERRALQRKEFDEHMKTVMQQMDDAKKKAAAEAEAREEEERRKVREAAEFHANPIKHFKPIVVKKSEKKLTEPKTPSVMKRSKGANLRM